MTRLPCHLAALAIATAAPAHAQDIDSGHRQPPAGVGIELSASTDSDDTDVIRLLGRGLWRSEGRDVHQGIAVERAWFRPQGQDVRKHDRLYLDFADRAGSKWLWRARVGTDGDTLLGSASIRSADWSKEFFVEREIVETPRGVDEGVYFTFLGASLDFPVNSRNSFNATAAVQTFTGKNERLHLRGTYVHAVKQSLGLSAQLRARFFHSTRPGEFDYYSPKNFVQVLPVVQLRRFDNAGWIYLAAVGYGAQKATGDGWRPARLADVRIESPARAGRLQAFAQLQYSNNSLNGSGAYRYLSVRAGLTTRF